MTSGIYMQIRVSAGGITYRERMGRRAKRYTTSQRLNE